MKKYFIYMFVALATILSSCDDDTDPGGTAVEKMAGDWYVQLLDEDGNDVGDGFGLINTYNTAANTSTEMFFDEYVWFAMKGKVKTDINSLTFQTDDFIDNEYGYGEFKIYEGKILPGAGHTITGRKADSIYVKFESMDEPGNIYIYAGHRRSGFIEDEP